MQVSVETTNGLERRMTVTVSRENLDSEIEKRLKSLAGRVKIQGFRPGKAPFKVVRQKHGADVEQEVKGDLIQSSFYEALEQEDLRPAGKPFIEPAKGEKGEDLEFAATFEVYPDFEIKGLDKVKIERPVAEVTDADVDNLIETLRNQHKEWADTDGEAKMGDQVIVNFVGTIDGEEFQGGTGNEVDVELGAKRMIPGLEEQLVGTKAGDDVNIKVSFPEEYPAKELAGKPAEFATTVVKVQEAVLPELDDEFAKKFGIDEGGVEALKKQVRDNLDRELDQKIQARITARVFDALVELKLCEVPKTLMDTEIENLMKKREQMLIQYGGSGQAPDMDPAEFQDEAERRVALGLLLSEIVFKNEIKVPPARLREEVEALASSYDDPDSMVKQYYADKERLSQVETATMEKLAVEWVLDQAKVADKEISFDDLMNPGQTAA